MHDKKEISPKSWEDNIAVRRLLRCGHFVAFRIVDQWEISEHGMGQVSLTLVA